MIKKYIFSDFVKYIKKLYDKDKTNNNDLNIYFLIVIFFSIFCICLVLYTLLNFKELYENLTVFIFNINKEIINMENNISIMKKKKLLILAALSIFFFFIMLILFFVWTFWKHWTKSFLINLLLWLELFYGTLIGFSLLFSFFYSTPLGIVLSLYLLIFSALEVVIGLSLFITNIFVYKNLNNIFSKKTYYNENIRF